MESNQKLKFLFPDVHYTFLVSRVCFKMLKQQPLHQNALEFVFFFFQLVSTSISKLSLPKISYLHYNSDYWNYFEPINFIHMLIPNLYLCATLAQSVKSLNKMVKICMKNSSQWAGGKQVGNEQSTAGRLKRTKESISVGEQERRLELLILKNTLPQN